MTSLYERSDPVIGQTNIPSLIDRHNSILPFGDPSQPLVGSHVDTISRRCDTTGSGVDCGVLDDRIDARREERSPRCCVNRGAIGPDIDARTDLR